ncbi:MAG: hypothetical protein DRK00_06445 [Thermoprotei archaeon]|nr:MAG: hypothetical protein DRK00_06445 [Thermoprotei archaeon]
MIVKYAPLREKAWRVARAVPYSLTISDVALKAGLPKYEVSRILSGGKGLENMRLGFEIDFRSAGILPISVISVKRLHRIPYMRSMRVLRVMGRHFYLYTSLLPEDDKIIEEWLTNFEEGALVIRGLDRVWWTPEAQATKYMNGEVCGVLDLLKVNDNETSPPIIKERIIELDEADAAILGVKLRWPFASLREAERESEKHLGKRIPHQTLSRHFQKHVLKIWRGNRVWLYRSLSNTPYRIFYLEGRDAVKLAKALVQLPWFHTAYLDVDKALVSGQPPCSSILPLYRAVGELDVEVLEMVMEPSMSKVVPIEALLRKLVRVKVGVGRR